jgi:hypothetical protein
MILARSVTRSISALHTRALGITVVHSENGRLVVIITAAFLVRSAMTCIGPADEIWTSAGWKPFAGDRAAPTH